MALHKQEDEVSAHTGPQAHLRNATSRKVGPDLVVDGLQELVPDGVAVLDALPRPCRATRLLK